MIKTKKYNPQLLTAISEQKGFIMTNERKIYTISFERNIGEEQGIIVDLLDGITVSQANKLEELFASKITEYGEENDYDYSEMDVYDIIDSVFDELHIQKKFSSVDFTIYY